MLGIYVFHNRFVFHAGFGNSGRATCNGNCQQTYGDQCVTPFVLIFTQAGERYTICR